MRKMRARNGQLWFTSRPKAEPVKPKGTLAKAKQAVSAAVRKFLK